MRRLAILIQDYAVNLTYAATICSCQAEAIYSVFGENVRATRDISTALARFQGPDEIVAGTNR
jgi:hypothetical protein